MPIRTLAVLTAALLAATPAAAQPTQAFHSDAGYTVQLPAAWRRMPEAELREVRRAATRSGVPLTIEAAYRAGEPGEVLPYAALATLDLGETITPEQFGAFFASPRAQAAMQEAADQTPAAQHGGRIGLPTWDAENGIVWSRMGMQSDGRSPAYSWSAATLHPDGRTMVMFIYYGAPDDDETIARDHLLAIARSLHAD
ncbi:MAG TPA: hypothetical protein VHG08_14080 [Longimicrobium sp.]|nr:hypothetical protein [Longimicrobium sp.]